MSLCALFFIAHQGLNWTSASGGSAVFLHTPHSITTDLLTVSGTHLQINAAKYKGNGYVHIQE